MIHIDMEAIKSSLIDLQQHFPDINRQLTVSRSVPRDETIDNMLAGYSKIEILINSGVDLLAMGNSEAILELNQTVLYHTSSTQLSEQVGQFEATKAHFYEADGGGIGGLMEWFQLNNHLTFWKKVAGIYCYMVAQPQLFIEGNHRVATLVVSYFLIKEGYQPFVVTVENAKAYFELSEQMKMQHKQGIIAEFISLPRLSNSLAELFENQQTKHYISNIS